MNALALRGLLIVGITYVLGVGIWIWGGAPANAAVFLGASYALTALAAVLFSRGILEFFLGMDREIAFFVVLRRVTDPLIALFAPLTPGFLLPFAVTLYTAFLFYFFKVFLFGDALLGVPPLFIVLFFFVAAIL